MIYTSLTKKAMQIAYDAHKGQVDKAGTPYIFHPLHVAEQMGTKEEVIVALLHDVVEDTGVTIDKLRSHGFSDHVLDALSLLTHDNSVEYMDYIIGIKSNPLATKVKLADLHHNTDTNRLDSIDEEVVERVEKYKFSIEVLLSSDNELQIYYDRIRKHIRLDDNRWFFLSIFSDKKGVIYAYSIDIEAAEDRHYTIQANEMKNLIAYFDDELVKGLKTYLEDHNESDLLGLFHKLNIRPEFYSFN